MHSQTNDLRLKKQLRISKIASGLTLRTALTDNRQHYWTFVFLVHKNSSSLCVCMCVLLLQYLDNRWCCKNQCTIDAFILQDNVGRYIGGCVGEACLATTLCVHLSTGWVAHTHTLKHNNIHVSMVTEFGRHRSHSGTQSRPSIPSSNNSYRHGCWKVGGQTITQQQAAAAAVVSCTPPPCPTFPPGQLHKHGRPSIYSSGLSPLLSRTPPESEQALYPAPSIYKFFIPPVSLSFPPLGPPPHQQIP